MMRGLLNQKGDRPAPREGEELRLQVENKTSKAGNSYIKFKRDRDGDGYKILHVEPSDRGPDDYGNLGYWLEVEESTDLLPPHTPLGNPPKKLNFRTAAGEPTPEYWDAKDRRIQRQHSQEMALRFLDLFWTDAGPIWGQTLDDEDAAGVFLNRQVTRLTDWFDKDATRAGRENAGSILPGAHSGGDNNPEGVSKPGAVIESGVPSAASESDGDTLAGIPPERVSDLVSRIETLGIQDDDVRMRMVRAGVTDIGSVDVALASLTDAQADEIDSWLQSIARLELKAS